MNNEGNIHREEISYQLLKILSQERNLTQRDMARKVGISLGKINYCVSELVRKGFVKVHRFKNAENKRAYAYILTPRGIQEKARITMNFLKRKILEYEEIKRQIEELSREVREEGLDHLLEPEDMTRAGRSGSAGCGALKN